MLRRASAEPDERGQRSWRRSSPGGTAGSSRFSEWLAACGRGILRLRQKLVVWLLGSKTRSENSAFSPARMSSAQFQARLPMQAAGLTRKPVPALRPFAAGRRQDNAEVSVSREIPLTRRSDCDGARSLTPRAGSSRAAIPPRAQREPVQNPGDGVLTKE